MIDKKAVVRSYIDGFRTGDHDKILSCLTEDTRWHMPGVFELAGKAAFDNEIENPGFEGHPDIQVLRLVEEGDVVIAEGTVRHDMTNQPRLDAVFCDVFVFRGDEICELTTYQVNR
jgi:ketosteroid isomerase-like protein